MLPGAKKNTHKKAVIKAVVSNDVKDHSKDPFFVQKAEASKKVMEKYGLPKHFITGKNK